MSKKKMCSNYDSAPCCKGGYLKGWCPRNTNSKCEIIPTKRKRIAKRTKTVKGWAVFFHKQVSKSPDRWITKFDYAALERPKIFKSIPCTITYEIKEIK